MVSTGVRRLEHYWASWAFHLSLENFKMWIFSRGTQCPHSAGWRPSGSKAHTPFLLTLEPAWVRRGAGRTQSRRGICNIGECPLGLLPFFSIFPPSLPPSSILPLFLLVTSLGRMSFQGQWIYVYVLIGASGLGEHTFETSSESCRGVLPMTWRLCCLVFCQLDTS